MIRRLDRICVRSVPFLLNLCLHFFCRMPPKGKSASSSSAPKRSKTPASKKRKGQTGESSAPPPRSPSPPPAPRGVDPPESVVQRIFDFDPRDRAYSRYQVMARWPVARQGRFDFEGLQSRDGWLDALKTFADGAGVWPLLEVDERAYEWPTKEFLSTLTVECHETTSEACVRFRLGGMARVCSIDEFGYRLGFYEWAEVQSGELSGLALISSLAGDAKSAFFKEIAPRTRGYSARHPRSQKWIDLC